MIVQVNKPPDFNELFENVKRKFSGYSVYTFDSNPQKTIIVRKSASVGAQITVYENQILVDACYPNVLLSAVMSLLTASTIFPFNAWVEFEKKVTNYLKRKYN